ncbi:MAG: hypothetical protein OEY52_13145 [Gammaproteobacteria bacterium]|nr:hypothetical protein [Gammaproteobacteria bacterium]
MLNRQLLVIIWVLVAGLSACSTAPEKEQGFEVGDDAQTSDRILPDRRTSKTVLALLDNARSAANLGQLSKSESQLERAMRIEPRNAVLWHYLAKLRLLQERTDEAAELAARSNSLARKNRKLMAGNWQIIAHARYQNGDMAGAQKAQQKVEQFKK